MKTSEEFDSMEDDVGGSVSTKPLDSIKEAVSTITKLFKINETHLAGFLGVSEKTLNDWKKRGMGELPPRAKRLVRLYSVVQYLQNEHKEIPEPSYKNLIENGRVILDPSDPEDGSTSLISYICAEPEATAWVACVEQVVKEFVRDHIIENEKHREAHPSVRHA